MCPLPQPLEQFGIAERDGRLQACAGPHLGQIHHGIDQARPPARRDMPGHHAQPDASGPGSFLAGHHLGRRDRVITVADFDVPGRIRIGHGSLLKIARAEQTMRPRPIPRPRPNPWAAAAHSLLAAGPVTAVPGIIGDETDTGQQCARPCDTVWHHGTPARRITLSVRLS